MLSIPAALKIFLAAAPTDMRKSHDGLAALVEHVLRENPLSGHLFVFRNKPGDRLKLLYWDTDGFALWYKRLEAGRFRFPAVSEGQTRVTITAAELTMLLDGVDLTSVRRTKRFRLPSEMSIEKPMEKSEKSLATA
jgi:transposase